MPKEATVSKAKCPVCKSKIEGDRCGKCGHFIRPSD